MSSRGLKKKVSHLNKVVADISSDCRFSGKNGSPSNALLEVSFAPDYILHMPCCSAVSLHRGMHSGGTTLGRDKVTYLDESLSPEGLFGQSLEATHAKPEQTKEHQTLHSITPRKELKSKQPVGAQTPVTPPTPPKRLAPSLSFGLQPVSQHPKPVNQHTSWREERVRAPSITAPQPTHHKFSDAKSKKKKKTNYT